MKRLDLGKAIAVTAEAFDGALDKSGRPYILHCLQVMNNVDKWEDDELRIIAVMHDLVEDTCFGFDILKEYGISHRALVALRLLTHKKSVPYDDYIVAICTNQDAIKVKMADLEHNSSILRLKGVREKDLLRIAKYHRSYLKLKECLL